MPTCKAFYAKEIPSKKGQWLRNFAIHVTINYVVNLRNCGWYNTKCSNLTAPTRLPSIFIDNPLFTCYDRPRDSTIFLETLHLRTCSIFFTNRSLCLFHADLTRDPFTRPSRTVYALKLFISLSNIDFSLQAITRSPLECRCFRDNR